MVVSCCIHCSLHEYYFKGFFIRHINFNFIIIEASVDIKHSLFLNAILTCSHWLHVSDVRKRLEQAHYLCVPRHQRRMLLLCFYFKGDAQQCVSRASRGHVATITQLAASPAQDAGTRHGDPGATLTPPRPSCAEVLLSRSPRITAAFCFAFRSQFVKLGWLIVLSQ